MFLSTEAREAYGDLQETIKQVVEEKPSGLISAEHYDLIRNMCSRLRTALTNDLQSRRGSS
jgi:dihydroneopterin aldolase